MIDPALITSIDPPPGGEQLNIQISEDRSKIWVCIDGAAVFRYKNLKKITLENRPVASARRAQKHGGSYQALGWVISTFQTCAGATRHVFEFDEPQGMLHIFSPEQIMFIDEWPEP